MKVLLVEDEPRIAEFVARGLRGHGFEVQVAGDGRTGLGAALEDGVDLLILDLGLPELSGEEVLERLMHARPELPVIILSAKDGIDDRVRNLNAGADDYVTKPFSFAELLARVEVRLRERAAPQDPMLAYGRVVLDVKRRSVSLDGAPADLTSREFELLEWLLRHPGQVLSHAQLLSHVWGPAERPGSNIVEVYIRHLRQKLAPDVIETVRGAGYRFVG